MTEHARNSVKYAVAAAFLLTFAELLFTYVHFSVFENNRMGLREAILPLIVFAIAEVAGLAFLWKSHKEKRLDRRAR